MWGIDMIGEIKPLTSNGHCFILVAIDYFTKWVEETSFATVTKNVVARFIRHNLICRYGVLESIILLSLEIPFDFVKLGFVCHLISINLTTVC